MITKENAIWLEQEGNLEFAKYFIGLGSNSKERKLREKSVNIASLWCRLFAENKDGYRLSEEMKPYLTKLLQKELNEFEKEESIWFEMCANCAQYDFAQIDEFNLTKALYGIFRILLPTEQKIEPFDALILEKLIEATGIDINETNQFGAAIKSHGLNSKIVIVPKEANTWTKFGDQYRLFLLS